VRRDPTPVLSGETRHALGPSDPRREVRARCGGLYPTAVVDRRSLAQCLGKVLDRERRVLICEPRSNEVGLAQQLGSEQTSGDVEAYLFIRRSGLYPPESGIVQPSWRFSEHGVAVCVEDGEADPETMAPGDGILALAGSGQIVRTAEHRAALEAFVLGQFSTARPCDKKANRPPGQAALAERARLLGDAGTEPSVDLDAIAEVIALAFPGTTQVPA